MARREGGKDKDHFRKDQCPPKFILGKRVISGSEYVSVKGPESTKTQALPSAAQPLPAQAQAAGHLPGFLQSAHEQLSPRVTPAAKL